MVVQSDTTVPRMLLACGKTSIDVNMLVVKLLVEFECHFSSGRLILKLKNLHFCMFSTGANACRDKQSIFGSYCSPNDRGLSNKRCLALAS